MADFFNFIKNKNNNTTANGVAPQAPVNGSAPTNGQTTMTTSQVVQSPPVAYNGIGAPPAPPTPVISQETKVVPPTANNAAPAQPPAESVSEVIVFAGGQEGYHTFRIPSVIVTPQGTVLVFCEGRKNGAGDSGDVDLVLKRSRDCGRTWSKLQVAWNDGANACGNPCPVLDRQTGTIWLLLTHNLGADNESQIMAGTSIGTRTVWVSRSGDDGLTWSQPVEITKQQMRGKAMTQGMYSGVLGNAGLSDRFRDNFLNGTGTYVMTADLA